MCLQVVREASRWCCDIVQRVKAHLLQIGNRADSWISSRGEEHLEKESFPACETNSLSSYRRKTSEPLFLSANNTPEAGGQMFPADKTMPAHLLV